MKYTPEQQRVAEYIVAITDGSIGGGEDPIGFLIASHRALGDKLKKAPRVEACERLGCRFEVAQSMLHRAQERGELTEDEVKSVAPSHVATSAWWTPPVRFDKDRGYFIDAKGEFVAVARSVISDEKNEVIASLLNGATPSSTAPIAWRRKGEPNWRVAGAEGQWQYTDTKPVDPERYGWEPLFASSAIATPDPDGERYRWLKKHAGLNQWRELGEVLPEKLDAALDAMAATDGTATKP